MIDIKNSKHKVIIQGTFLTYAMTIADPIILLPLLISFFSDNYILIGLFIALYKTSGILVQHYSAYKIQSNPYVMKNLSNIFILRVFSWLLISFSIIFLGNTHPTITLCLIALGLSMFSISYSVGAIYYNEILGKIFTRSFRGVTLARRQFFSAIGLLLAAVSANYVLKLYDEPTNFGILFLLSSVIMSIGLYIFVTIPEPKKLVTRTDSSFKKFTHKSIIFLKADKKLQKYLISYFLTSTYLLSLPYIIIESKNYLEITSIFIAELILFESAGLLIGNIIWAKLAYKNQENLILIASVISLIILFIVALNISSHYYFYLIFFLYGFATDGIKLVYNNMLIHIAPQDRRPIYSSLKSHITSLGFLFPIMGGIIINISSLTVLFYITLLALILTLLYIIKHRHLLA